MLKGALARVLLGGQREQAATAFCPEGSNFAESVEFPVSHSAEKGMPLARGELENRAGGVLAVADTDLAAGQARDLDAVAVGEAQRTLNPVRT
jgi:hypothetical protein